MSDGNVISSKLECNKHVARDLRRRLEQRHAKGTAARDMLGRLSDAELVALYLSHEEQGRAHVAKRQAEKGTE